MKGLVLKDLLLMLKMDKKVMIVLYSLVVVTALGDKREVYAIMSTGFFSLFIGMHLMMTMTYDGMSSWKQYELTLPMNKYQIIGSKYVTCLLLTPISVIGTVIIYIVRYVVYHCFSFNQFGFSIAIAILLPVLWCSICLAFAQWFGYMNVQYARMAGIILLALFVNYMPKDKILIMWDFIQTPKLVVGSSLGVIVVAYIVSVIGYSRKK